MATRHITPALREHLFARSQGTCERGCGTSITLESFHAAHLRAHAHGGPAILANLAAWCARCNLVNGARDVIDTRTPAREWQLEALEVIVPRLIDQRAATLSAAPAAGKTMFAGLVFNRLAELGFVRRMVVLVPRNTLVKQWAASLLEHTHLQLRPDSAHEREGQSGVIVTYQSLMNDIARHDHMDQLSKADTLLALDEVHHVGEPSQGGVLPAWARYVGDLAGNTGGDLRVRAVLNLSGTLWRSLPGQRISTVNYAQLPDGKLQALVDFDIDAVRLIREKQLRPVDLTRLGASVRLNDFRDLKVIDSHTTDLSEDTHGRAVLRGLTKNPEWRRVFVGAVLDRLEVQHRSLQKHHVKALIVADKQANAELLAETANAMMRERGMHPLAVVAHSDMPDAAKILDDFRKQRRAGILCTVDMAGEGYDCPDICVVGYASNKQTPLYIRQVVARAQRVTARERELGHIVPAMVVAPDVPELVKLLMSILAPMHHEIAAPEPIEERGPRVNGAGMRDPKFGLGDVTPDADSAVGIVEDQDWQIAGQLRAEVERALDAEGLPSAHATRTLHALDRMIRERTEQAPFDPLSPFELTLQDVSKSAAPKRGAPVKRTMTVEESVAGGRRFLSKAGGWWKINGDPSVSVAQFQFAVNDAAGIPVAARDEATIEQLRAAARYAMQLICAHCDKTGGKRPNFSEWV